MDLQYRSALSDLPPILPPIFSPISPRSLLLPRSPRRLLPSLLHLASSRTFSRSCRNRRGPCRHGGQRSLAVGGLGLLAAAYVGVDYLRHLSPTWHWRLQPALWVALALATVARAPFYRRWDAELRAAPRFLAAMAFMLAAFLCEAISVRFVSTVLGLQWHR